VEESSVEDPDPDGAENFCRIRIRKNHSRLKKIHVESETGAGSGTNEKVVSGSNEKNHAESQTPKRS
jgi:hypothetical protein